MLSDKLHFSKSCLPIYYAEYQHTIEKLLVILEKEDTAILNLVKTYGAIIFRGFACTNENLFSKLIAACDFGERCSTADYRIPRTVLSNNIYTSSDLAPAIAIPLHHEKPRSMDPPTHIYFGCLKAPVKGGATLFANAIRIWRDLPDPIKENIIKHGVCYQRYIHKNGFATNRLKKIFGRKAIPTLHSFYGSDDKATIFEKLQSGNEQFEWLNGGDLKLWQKLPGVFNHPLSNEPVWFNSADYLNCYYNLLYKDFRQLTYKQAVARRYLIYRKQLPLVCHYGNGQPFSKTEIQLIANIISKHMFAHDWQTGDFMIVDNYTLMHGKQPHKGERLLLSCMTKR